MKLIFYTIIFFLFNADYLAAQVTEGIAPVSEKKHHTYFFKSSNFLREDIKLNIGKTYSKNDSLQLFISDSIKFHQDHFYYHQQSPHACQNRFYKAGFVNAAGEIIIPFEYDWVQPEYHSFMLVRRGDLTGVINSQGKIITPFRYAFYYIHDTSLIAFRNAGIDSGILFYDKRGKFLFQVNGYSAKRMSKDFISIFRKNEKFKGVIDGNGRWIIEAGIYDNVKWISGDFICALKNGKFGVINSKNTTILPFEYDNIRPAGDNWFIGFKNGLTGVLNANNEVIIPFDSSYIVNFGKLFGIRRYRSAHWGLINSNGDRLLGEKYNINFPGNLDEIEIKKVDLQSILRIEDPSTRLIGAYRADGLKILPVEYSYLDYRPDFDAVIIGKKSDTANRFLFSAIDRNGKVLLRFSENQLRHIDYSPNILLSVNTKGAAAFVNARTGEIVTDYEFDGIAPAFPLTDGYVAAKKDWRYALISPEGKKLTDIVYAGFYPATKQNKSWFSEVIVCLGRLGEKLYGITETGKAIPAKQ